MNIRIAVFLLTAFFLVAGCSDGSDSPDPSSVALKILVTNDDGIDAPGIDALVNTLLEMENVEIEVVAPAENQSGSSDRTTEGDLVWQDSATTSGYPAVAVFGFPADSVLVALNELNIEPHVVVSGVNRGQNVGPLAELSGTVGAARTAAREGFPAVATSAGITIETADFAAGASLVVSWIEENRLALITGTAGTETVTSFNVPGCTAGEIRELREVARADSLPPPPQSVFFTDCSIEPDGPPVSDVDAMLKGFAAETDVELVF